MAGKPRGPGPMKVAVLGAGVVGVTTAYYLSRLGCEVTVVDRQAQVAAETSFANGGQLSVSHAEPWANPRAPRKILAWLLHGESPIRWCPSADPQLWWWGLRFLRECLPGRTRHNVRQLVNLGLYSRAALQALRAETGLRYQQRACGILHIYTHAGEFEAAVEAARVMTALGCERRILGPDEAVRIEPALRNIRDRLCGATYTPGDESGDAQIFTRELAQRCAAAGVRFLMNHRITALHADGGRVAHAELIDDEGRFQRLQADAYVLALGSHSAGIARRLGLRLPIQPAKGYSLTLPVASAEAAYETALIDDEHKIVFSRLGDRLRVAGMAEVGNWSRALDPARCALLLRRAQELFPGAGDVTQASYWCGLRPATPSNLPCIGRSHLRGLFLNTGHGTLGWTHACGSGQAVADIICGRKPEADFDFRL
ncbi:D-amino acid dehydrogenase [Fontimonas sp. SYSU GA230001]|uniref:D-amino acid dehydrogenase n=1 Tax=Fontimonas sp. SYSU GA230001 TaxID=3142450 RepID=UPI0032B61102